jgi:cbb3-type cytochrome oxidase subunit 3
MSSDLSAEITAIATAALAAFAIFTTVFAILAFRKQSKEVSDQAAMLKVQSDQLEEQRKVNAEQTRVLALQVKELGESLEERRREALERRSSQASQVFVREERYTYHAVGKPPEKDITVYVRNTSKQPVYEVWFSWHSGGRPYTQYRRDEPLMPNGQDRDSAQVPTEADPDKFGAAVIFRDRAGVWWRAHPDGRLDEVEPGSEPSSMPPSFF